MAHRCRSVSAAHMSSLACPHLTCSKRRWLHHLQGALPAALRRQFGPAELLLPHAEQANCWQAFTSSSTHIILTTTNQFPIHHFFFHSRDTFLRLHSLHPAPIPATAILAYPTRTHSKNERMAASRICIFLSVRALDALTAISTPKA